MKLIKVGSRYINLEMITDVYAEEGYLDVYFAAPMGERATSESPWSVQTRYVRVSGEDAEQLARWLDAHLVKA